MPSSGNDANTKLLLHCDGTNGSTSFPDVSSNAKTVAVNGNAQVSTAQQKFGTGAYLGDGGSDWLTVTNSTDFNFGTGDFTLDFISVGNSYFLTRGSANTCDAVLNAGSFVFYIASVAVVTQAWAPSTATWYHVAVVRNGTNCFVFINGTQLGSTGTSSASIGTPGANPDYSIGALFNGALSLNGYMDEIRISNIARWTTAFTPETTPYGQASAGLNQAIFL